MANGDLVFRAKCSGDQVVSTVKYGGDAYWHGNQLLVKLGAHIFVLFPDRGVSIESSTPLVSPLCAAVWDFVQTGYNCQAEIMSGMHGV